MSTVIYVGGELPDKNAAAHRVISNAKALREIGYNVVLIGSSINTKSNMDVLDTQTDFYGFMSFLIPYPTNTSEWIRYVSDSRAITRVVDKFSDVKAVVLYNHPSISFCKIRNYCKKNSINLIADITEWYPGLDGGIVRRIIKKTDTFIRMTLLQKHIDGLIVISRFLQNYYSKCKNVHYIPPLIDISDSKWGILEEKKDDTVLKLIYAGNPGRKDSLNELIEAVNNAERNISLAIVGITEENYMALYKNEPLKVNKDRISFFGRLPHEDVIRFLKSSNYSCFFRENNLVSKAGFPTKFGEALACNIGVITNRTSDLEEYIGQNKNGLFVNSLSAEDIKNVIESAPLKINTEKDLMDFHKYLKEFKDLMECVFD